MTLIGKDIAGNMVEHSWTFNTTRVGNVEGYLRDDEGGALVNVEVHLSNGMNTETDSSGHFIFENVIVGHYTLNVELVGFENLTKNVNVDETETTDLGNLEMTIVDSEDESSGTDGALLIIGCVVLLVSIGGVGYFIYQRKKK